MNIYRNYLKTPFDIIVVLITLPLTLPVIFITSILILVIDGAPLFFLQRRTGKNLKPFNIIKFRTMTDRERAGEFDLNEVTKLGEFLRKTSLDELPSIFNVLKGDMSLIGPRPYLHSYLGGYSERQKARFILKPGLSGLLQVRQRNSCTWSTKFRYDEVYQKHVTFRFDCYLIAQTIKVILFPKSNISGKGSSLFYDNEA